MKLAKNTLKLFLYQFVETDIGAYFKGNRKHGYVSASSGSNEMKSFSILVAFKPLYKVTNEECWDIDYPIVRTNDDVIFWHYGQYANNPQS